MKTRLRTLFVVLMVAGVALTGCADEDGVQATGYAQNQTAGGGRGAGPGQGMGRGASSSASGGVSQTLEYDTELLISDLPVEPLSAEERSGLIFMWEEEKLARDVYQALYEIWNLPVFSSISASEQTHMDSIAVLFDRYGIELPASQGDPGSFADSSLQAAYDELLADGRESLAAALTVGATIEDLDIADLQTRIAGSDNDDIRVIYQNLMKGSRNHIRSFISQLERFGEDYEATYISDEYLRQIRAISRETAPITDPLYAL